MLVVDVELVLVVDVVGVVGVDVVGGGAVVVVVGAGSGLPPGPAVVTGVGIVGVVSVVIAGVVVVVTVVVVVVDVVAVVGVGLGLGLGSDEGCVPTTGHSRWVARWIWLAPLTRFTDSLELTPPRFLASDSSRLAASEASWQSPELSALEAAASWSFSRLAWACERSPPLLPQPATATTVRPTAAAPNALFAKPIRA